MILSLAVVFAAVSTPVNASYNASSTEVRASVSRDFLTTDSRLSLNVQRGKGFRDALKIRQNGVTAEPETANLSVKGNVSEVIQFNRESVEISSERNKEFEIGYTVNTSEKTPVGVYTGNLTFSYQHQPPFRTMSSGRNHYSLGIEIAVLPTIEEFREEPEVVVDHDTEYVENTSRLEKVEKELENKEEELNKTRDRLETYMEMLDKRRQSLVEKRVEYIEQKEALEGNLSEKKELQRRIDAMEEDIEEVEQQKEKAEKQMDSLTSQTPAARMVSSGSGLSIILAFFLLGTGVGHYLTKK